MKNEDVYFKYEWKYKKEDFKFCPRCGKNLVLEDVHIYNQPQLICHNCQFIFYIDPKVVVNALVTFEKKVLLLQRAEEPGVGLWSFPGGYVERGHDIFDSIKREIKEEAGLDVDIEGITKIYSLKESGIILIMFEAIANNEDVIVNIESMDGRFFTVEEIPWDSIAFNETKECLLNYVRKIV